ncbi:PREDICTED: protein LMBR1L-like isoform X2 [Branchiostoma belcheri]|uniref:Protein LMBR1L-like isoform X2 n=1 Tax=Branchiostoma belcheri TaxID=7741 RepID=A0A6P5AW16_BRABE|nr:PREDICTED: protein LMBR1L-like isoform X2 [Branchiostoma belcheri]
MADESADDVWNPQEQVFHNAVREYVISLLLFMALYGISFIVTTKFRKRSERDDFYQADDDAWVYRISLWICTFTLAVSAAAVLLLPISIISNEILLIYPKSWYMKWLNSSLIHGLWNHVFLFSNLSLFILMPFAYFFTESEGFMGSKKGIMARVYETFVVLFLLGVLVVGLVWVASALLDQDTASRESLLNFWNFYLPYLYSCISLLGVLLLLVCTPLGFARLFTVVGQLLVKPRFMTNIEEDIYSAKFEEDNLLRKLKDKLSPISLPDKQDLRKRLLEVQTERKKLERRQKASAWQRNLGYPLVMLLLLALTGTAVFIVSIHTLGLLFGGAALPVGVQDIGLGQASLSMFGVLGASVEIVLILYLMVASVVGFYSVPLFSRIRPTKANTPMTMVIANCLVLLTMSSALPVLSRTIGITHFDLLGYFGRFNWLGNFYIVLLYNVVFAVGTGLCLVKKFSVSVRRELYARLRMYSPVTRRRQSRTESMSAAVAHTANGMTATMAASLNPANETGAATATGSNSTNENLSNGTAHSIKSD